MGKFLNKNYLLLGGIVLLSAIVLLTVELVGTVFAQVPQLPGDCIMLGGLVKCGSTYNPREYSNATGNCNVGSGGAPPSCRKGGVVNAVCNYPYSSVGDSQEIKSCTYYTGTYDKYNNCIPETKNYVVKVTCQKQYPYTYTATQGPDSRRSKCETGGCDIDMAGNPYNCTGGAATNASCDPGDALISKVEGYCPVATPGGTQWIKYTTEVTCGPPTSIPSPVVIQKPAAPTNLEGTYDEGEEVVNLSWDSVDNADNYEIFRAPRLEEFQLLARVGSGVTSYFDKKLGAKFKGGMRYKVRALNAGGASGYSDIRTVEVVPAVGGPTVPVFVPPVCSVSNPTPSAWYPVDFLGANFQTTQYKYVWQKDGKVWVDNGGNKICRDDSTSCQTGPLTADLNEGAYKIEVRDLDSNQVKQTINCPAVDVKFPRLKAEVISR